MAFNITLNKKLNTVTRDTLTKKVLSDSVFKQELLNKGYINEQIDSLDGITEEQPIGKKGTGWIDNYELFDLIANAIKTANPSMSGVDFTNFGFRRSGDSKLNRTGTPYQKGDKVKPIIEMVISPVPEISRRYNDDSKLFKFNLTAPNFNQVVAEAITIENIGELSWDDYNKVKKVLNDFCNKSDTVKVIPVGENENSKYLHLVYTDGSGRFDIGHLFSIDMDWNSQLGGIPVLSFHFTRAEEENKETIVLDNSNITVNKDPLLKDSL